MLKMLQRFLKDASGATAIEYGLIVALILVAIIAGAATLGHPLNEQLSSVSNAAMTGETGL